MKGQSIKKRNDLVNAAYALFQEHGFHATGVDAIATEARTTKRTLYRIFGSKENLALEVLRRHDEGFRRDMHQRIEAAASDPVARLLGLFDYYGAWFDSEDFRGCIFIKTMIEFAASSPSLSNAAKESKELVRSYIEKLCKGAGASNPGQLSAQLQILLEGSIIVAQANPESAPATKARAIAEHLVSSQLP